MGYLWYLLIPIGFWLFICLCGFIPMIMLRFTNFNPVANAVPIFDKSLDVVNPVWLQQRGFKGVCAIKPIGIPMAVYLSQDRKIALLIYFAGGQRVCEFVTQFPGHIGITTSSTIDGPVAPAPRGATIQSFKGADPDDLLRKHLRAVTFIQSQIQVAAKEHHNVSSGMQESITRQFNFMLTQPWHILTIPYRFAILRFMRTGNTIEQQVQKGIINIDKLKRQAQIPSRSKAA